MSQSNDRLDRSVSSRARVFTSKHSAGICATDCFVADGLATAGDIRYVEIPFTEPRDRQSVGRGMREQGCCMRLRNEFAAAIAGLLALVGVCTPPVAGQVIARVAAMDQLQSRPLGGTRLGPATRTAPTTRPSAAESDDPAERLPSTRPSPAALPSPLAVSAERKKIWTEFRVDYDAHLPGDRDGLAHKLMRRAVAETLDPARRFALLREAQELAADSRDRALALKTAEAIAFYFDADPLAEKMRALSAGAWPDDEEPAARALLDDWDSLSVLAAQAGRFDLAETAARRAVALARHWGDEQWVRSAEAQLRVAEQGRDRQLALDAAVKTLASHPDDPKANELVGCDLAAKGQWPRAIAMLRRAADPVLRLAANGEASDPAKPAAQIDLADAWAGASQRQPAQVQAAFASRARHWYALALRGLSGADKQVIERRLRALPGATIFDAAALAVGDPRRIDPLGGSGGAKFDDLPAQGAVLVGFRLSTGPVYGNPCVCAVQPLFLGESGRIKGATHGKEQAPFQTVEARPGYAVGGLVVKTGWAVDGFKIVFMRIRGQALDPADKYESAWFGGCGGTPETTLACDGKPVIGIQGRGGDGLDAIGLVEAR